MQLFLPNGKIGASGPNALPRVVRGSKPGLVLAMTRSLGATKSVLEVQLKWPSVMKKNAQVLLS